MQITETPVVVPEAPEDNITDLLEQRVKATPDLVLFSTPVSETEWADVTAREFRDSVI